jgi:hypothetical protein
LNRWLSERGLTLAEPLPENHDKYISIKVIGSYYDNCLFGKLPEGVETKKMSNGRYTRATITDHPDGSKVINYHNVNVRDRIEYDSQETKKELDSDPKEV